MPTAYLGGLAPGHAADPDALVQQGVDRYYAGDLVGAIAPWQAALQLYQADQNSPYAAIVLENLARTVQETGNPSDAIRYWDQAIALYRSLNNPEKLNRAISEQAQAYSRLGQHRRALALLCNSLRSDYGSGESARTDGLCASGTALALAREGGDRLGEAVALASIGEAHRLLGEFEPSRQALALAQTLVEALPEVADESDESGPTGSTRAGFRLGLLSSQGNIGVAEAKALYRRSDATIRIGDAKTARDLEDLARQDDRLALDIFEQGLALAIAQKNLPAQLKLQVGLVPLYRRLGQGSEAAIAFAQAQALLSQLPASQEVAFGWMDLAVLSDPNQRGLGSSRRACPVNLASGEARGLLERGRAIAQQLQNQRLESFALGQLGRLAECQRDYAKALELTQEARLAADASRAGKESAYLWDWQMGRIWKAQNQEQLATIFYQQAVKSLSEIRGDILTSNQDLQFDFRDTVEPIYRELAALNLAQIPPSQALSAADAAPELVETTLETVDALKLAELQNYFGSDCIITPATQAVTALKTANTAIINTLIFEDRLAVIYSFPSGATQLEWVSVKANQLRETTIDFRRMLENFKRANEYKTALGEQMYDWLVRPFVAQLETEEIATLVFIQDGILRSVPMAALYDGKQYLIERYAVATTPSLQLTDPKPLTRDQNLSVLALGVADEQLSFREFGALPGVQTELQAVQQSFPGAKVFLNDQFNPQLLKQEFAQSNYPIVHVATHGKFGAEPQDNFLLTGSNDKITISELDRLIRDASPAGAPIELLALTACQTAIGDDRAALGLAGVAVRAGARSAIASLWSINDESTAQVMDAFYRLLATTTVSKAEALRLAQVGLIEQGGEAAHPARWAPYLLIGNWL